MVLIVSVRQVRDGEHRGSADGSRCGRKWLWVVS